MQVTWSDVVTGKQIFKQLSASSIYSKIANYLLNGVHLL